MTPRLDAIRARLAARTPGEWSYEEITDRGIGGEYEVFAPTYRADGKTQTPIVCEATYEPNADLIAHAPADLEFLLSEVSRLRGALEFIRDEGIEVEAWSYADAALKGEDLRRDGEGGRVPCERNRQ